MPAPQKEGPWQASTVHDYRMANIYLVLFFRDPFRMDYRAVFLTISQKLKLVTCLFMTNSPPTRGASWEFRFDINDSTFFKFEAIVIHNDAGVIIDNDAIAIVS